MEINYQIIRSRKRRKTLSLKITAQGAVVIQAPYHTPPEEIALFFARKKAWLEEKLLQFRELAAPPPSQPLISGQALLFLGVSYPLIVGNQGSQVELFTLKERHFVLNSRVVHHGRALARSWYEAQARIYLSQRIGDYEKTWDLRPRGVRISNAASRWGSCSPMNLLSFTWRLMMAPPHVIDYVIVHELAHIGEKNHSRRFWDLVSRMMPDYQTHRRWLREQGHRLRL